MRKKLICILLAIVLVFSLVPAGAVAAFSDSSGHWAQSAIDRWSGYKVVNGYPDGSFHPEGKITRAEMATILCNLLLLREKSDAEFTDVSSGDWYEAAMRRCVAAGIMRGDGTGLRPRSEITREEAVTMVARAFGISENAAGADKFADKDKISVWARGSVGAMAEANYVQGDEGGFRPQDSLTRAEAVTIINNMVSRYITEPGSYELSGGGFVIVASQGAKLSINGFTGKIIETDFAKANSATVAYAESGTYVGYYEDNGMVTFRGVKYADFEPFQAPTLAKEERIVYADTAGPGSTQGAAGCLNVSIFLNPNYSGPRHVYMYQYGSAQLGGSNATQQFKNFVEKNPDIIVVTPNHRGGFFGSIDLSQLEGYEKVADKYKYSNNLSRLDLLACLKWINANISAFGGDPNDVTIGGHSSGSNNMTCLLMMREAQPYYNKALCQASFSVDISLQALETAKFVSADLFDKLGVKTIEEFLALSNEQIYAGQRQIQANSMSGATAYANIENKLLSPVIDGVVIPEDYYDRLLGGLCTGKTVIFGSNAGEYDQQYVDKDGNPLSDDEALDFTISQNWGKLSSRGWNAANAQAVIDEFYSHNEEYGRDNWTAAKDLKNDLYLRTGAIMFAEALSLYTDTYFYHLDWDVTPENNLRASHGSENRVVARNWDGYVPENMLDGAEMISNLWAAFIRTGDPNTCAELPCTWTRYNGTTHDTLYIAPDAKDSRVVEGQRQKDVDLLLPLLREYPKLAEAKKLAASGKPITEKVSSPGKYSGYTEAEYDGYNRYSLYVPARDGTKIALDYYLPTSYGIEETKALPVVFTWTPYNRARLNADGSISENADMLWFTSHGYAFAIADCRGMGASYGYRDSANSPTECRDGADMVAWIYKQKWCNGKIGTIGSSYVGQTQLEILSESKLVTASVIGCTDYNKYDGWIRGGVPRAFGSQPDTLWEGVHEGGTATVESVAARTVPVDADTDGSMLREAIEQHKLNGLQIPMFQRLLWRDSYAEETKGEYWNQVSASSHADALDASGSAVYILGGLYDVFRRDSFVSFVNMDGAMKMTIGPWYHTKPKTEVEWPIEQLRWFDYWLKDIDNGIMDEPPIYLKTANLINSDNGYRWFETWPGYAPALADTFYLTSDKAISASAQTAAAPISYQAVYGIKTGVEDANAADVNEKGLMFQTAALAADTEITGHPMAHLYVEMADPGYLKSNYDTDVFVTLSDYDPETGEAFIFSDGHIRASLRAVQDCPYDFLGLPWHRANEADASYIELDKIYQLDIDLMPCSYIVKKGHQITVTFSSSMDRFYYLGRAEFQADPNTKGPTLNFYTGGTYASSIELPHVYGK